MAAGLKKINSIFKSEEGATSVLIIFMMIVLVTLGAFSITSANVNLKFSRKSVDLNKVYYDLDASGEKFLHDFDSQLAAAEKKAAEYMSEKGYMSDESAEIPMELQAQLNEKAGKSNNKEENMADIFNSVYLYWSLENLKSLADEKYSELTIMPYTEDGAVLDIFAEFNIQSDIQENANLKIGIDVNELNYEIAIVSDNVSGLKNNTSRYMIVDWTEWQVPFEYDNEIELWDGQL